METGTELDDVVACTICGAKPRCMAHTVPGYVAPATYRAYHCSICDVTFAWPLLSDPAVYDLIYRNAHKLPGYGIYNIRAKMVKRVSDPLDYLAEESATYWAIREYLNSNPKHLHSKILELGCGMGYLTYALRKRGYDCVGVDLSSEAVSKARRRYGDNYYLSDIGTDTGSNQTKYDVVILTEVIEHVEDPSGLLKAIGHRLSPGGEIVLTTPNKDSYMPDDVWNTDLPPVHLWWFSKNSVVELAKKSGFTEFSFIDFEGCPKGFFADPKPVDWMERQTLDETGQLIYRGHQKFSKILSVVNLAVDLRLQEFLFQLRPSWRRHVASHEGAEGKPSTICAMISGQSQA